MTSPFDQLIRSRNANVADFLVYLDSSIVMADDIIDRQVRPDRALDVLECLNSAMLIAINTPGLYEAVSKNYFLLLEAERADMEFVPGKMLKEVDMLLWMRRGYRASIEFDCLCFVDPSFETKENRDWIFKAQNCGLILNDCSDILSEEYEDFIQCRRNYVALSRFDHSIYSSWRDKKQELADAAKEESQVKLDAPSDQRLMPFYDLIKEASHGVLL